MISKGEKSEYAEARPSQKSKQAKSDIEIKKEERSKKCQNKNAKKNQVMRGNGTKH
jgi:hypothetical protein